MLKISYFASVREQLGCDSENLELPAAVTDVGGLIGFLAHREGHESWKLLAEPGSILVAVDQAVADRETPLRGDEEVAFFPPMTGG